MRRACGTVIALLLFFAGSASAVGSAVYVTTNGTGDGSSWAQAASLANALVICDPGDEIWIAQGTYTNDWNGTNSFLISTNNLMLYGGFTNGMAFGDRDWTNYPVMLDGLAARRVMEVSGTNVTVDGLVITNGYFASGTSGGAGIYKSGDGSLALINCRIVGNKGGNWGGGCYFVNGSVTLTNCTFALNVPYSKGCYGYGFYASGADVVVSDCVFNRNWYGSIGIYGARANNGGGFYFENGTLSVSDCTFSSNSVPGGYSTIIYGGGGAYIAGVSTALVQNCVFEGNEAIAGEGLTLSDGGGLFVNVSASQTVTVENCTFARNRAYSDGGAVYVSSGNLVVKNSILWSNTVDVGTGNEVYNVPGASASIYYSCLSGTRVDDVFGDVSQSNVMTNDPLFATNDFTDLHLKSYSGRWDPATGEFPKRTEKKFLFKNRHIDRRYYIEYPRATRNGPRIQGRTIRDTYKEWDIVIEHRDRYLKNAGLTLDSPERDVARCMGDSFGHDTYFGDKGICPSFPNPNPVADTGDVAPGAHKIEFTYERALANEIEALLYKSNCAGCAAAFGALADSCGLAVRRIGCGGHILAEVRVDGRWYKVDNGCRHPWNVGKLDSLFESNFMQMGTDPMGCHGKAPDTYCDGLWRRPNGQYHFSGGMWQVPGTLRFATSNAYALYPEVDDWSFKSETGTTLPVILRAGGFYWSCVHTSEGPAATIARKAALPMPMHPEGIAGRCYLFHPFRPGEKLRQSFWLDSLDGMTGLEVVLTFGASTATDFSDAIGKDLVVKLGDFERSLADLGAWPPVDGGEDEPVTSTITIPVDALQANAVNWLTLNQNSTTMLYAPCLPAVMEPYIAPLWSETEDRVNPPLPKT